MFQTRPLEGITKIGEPLSILIFLSDQGEGRFNVKAQVIAIHVSFCINVSVSTYLFYQDCWAYDSEYFEDSTTTKVQLTTRDGCPVYDNPTHPHYHHPSQLISKISS